MSTVGESLKSLLASGKSLADAREALLCEGASLLDIAVAVAEGIKEETGAGAEDIFTALLKEGFPLEESLKAMDLAGGFFLGEELESWVLILSRLSEQVTAYQIVVLLFKAGYSLEQCVRFLLDNYWPPGRALFAVVQHAWEKEQKDLVETLISLESSGFQIHHLCMALWHMGVDSEEILSALERLGTDPNVCNIIGTLLEMVDCDEGGIVEALVIPPHWKSGYIYQSLWNVQVRRDAKLRVLLSFGMDEERAEEILSLGTDLWQGMLAGKKRLSFRTGTYIASRRIELLRKIKFFAKLGRHPIEIQILLSSAYKPGEIVQPFLDWLFQPGNIKVESFEYAKALNIPFAYLVDSVIDANFDSKELFYVLSLWLAKEFDKFALGAVFHAKQVGISFPTLATMLRVGGIPLPYILNVLVPASIHMSKFAPQETIEISTWVGYSPYSSAFLCAAYGMPLEELMISLESMESQALLPPSTAEKFSKAWEKFKSNGLCKRVLLPPTDLNNKLHIALFDSSRTAYEKLKAIVKYGNSLEDAVFALSLQGLHSFDLPLAIISILLEENSDISDEEIVNRMNLMDFPEDVARKNIELVRSN